MTDVSLAALELADLELGRLEFVIENLGLDGGSTEEGAADGARFFSPGGENPVEIEGVADFGGNAKIHVQFIAGLDTVLVTAVFENRKHAGGLKVCAGRASQPVRDLSSSGSCVVVFRPWTGSSCRHVPDGLRSP